MKDTSINTKEISKDFRWVDFNSGQFTKPKSVHNFSSLVESENQSIRHQESIKETLLFSKGRK